MRAMLMGSAALAMMALGPTISLAANKDQGGGSGAKADPKAETPPISTDKTVRNDPPPTAATEPVRSAEEAHQAPPAGVDPVAKARAEADKIVDDAKVEAQRIRDEADADAQARREDPAAVVEPSPWLRNPGDPPPKEGEGAALTPDARAHQPDLRDETEKLGDALFLMVINADARRVPVPSAAAALKVSEDEVRAAAGARSDILKCDGDMLAPATP